MAKVCTKCGLEKDLDGFEPKRNVCKKCRQEQRKSNQTHRQWKYRTKYNITLEEDWNETEIATRFLRRWDIEVWHREGKGRYGIEDCQLRSYEGVSKHLTLSALAATLLEIASLLSPVYATLQNRGWTPELKHRWVLAELVSQLISSASQVQDLDLKQVIESILCPYTSTLREGMVKNMMDSEKSGTR